MRAILLGRILLAVTALVAACGDEGPTDPSARVPASITITPSSVTLAAIGQTVQLTAAARDQSGQIMTGVAITWASSDGSVATVDSTGLVTAVWNGSVEITASSVSGVAGSADVTVQQQARELRIGPASYTFAALKDTVRLTAEAVDSNGNPIVNVELAWASGNAAVATVDTAGLVTAQSEGSTTITAVSGPARASIAVTVSQQAAEVQVSPAADTLLALQDTLRLSAEAVDGNGNPVNDPLFAWSSSDEAVVTVDSLGMVVAVGNGSASVTARSGDAEGSSAVVVEQLGVKMQVSPTVDTLRALDDTLRLAAAVVDANGYPVAGLLFHWSSSDESIASVDARGLVTTITPGTVRITARFSGTDLAGQSKLVVELRPRDILTRLYSATDGPNWSNNHNWLTDAPLGSWYGVKADGEGRVYALDLRENGLAGPLPRDIGYLADLGGLWIADNRLTGAIPPELGRLERLAQLDMSRNALTGPIPPEFGELAELRLLWLSDNRLSGKIPPQLGRLGKLTQLHLGLNSLTGSIPPELGGLRSLRGLRLARNGLEGSIPAELGNLVVLGELYLHGNNLSGPVPPQLGGLRELRSLRLDNNGFTGPIPADLGNLSELRSLILHTNRLTGPIPGELGELHNLGYLNLAENALTGPIPPELGRMTNVGQLHLENNALTGPIPGELGELRDLNWLNLSENALTGPIPPELGRLEKVRTLRLGGNRLVGSLPPEMHAMHALRSLEIMDNPLSGPIPQSFVALALFHFDWTTTDLCAPRDEAFQAWLRSIERQYGGAACPP